MGMASLPPTDNCALISARSLRGNQRPHDRRPNLSLLRGDSMQVRTPWPKELIVGGGRVVNDDCPRGMGSEDRYPPGANGMECDQGLQAPSRRKHRIPRIVRQQRDASDPWASLRSRCLVAAIRGTGSYRISIAAKLPSRMDPSISSHAIWSAVLPLSSAISLLVSALTMES